MVYNRGSAADYDAMAALGNPGWSWRHILPVYRTIENHELGADPMRGSGGPLDISVDTHLPQICSDVITAGANLGWSPTNDLNGGDTERIGPAPRTIKNGRRVSAAHAFLHPVTHRANLRVATDTTANRVLFEGDKAVGVETTTSRGATASYTARREVILSLGSISTPRLLQLSGVGDRSLLRGLGIDTIADSPNVGRRMREHLCFAIQFRLNRDVGYNRQLSTPLRQAATAAKYLATRRGPLAGAAFDVVGFFKTSPELERPDAQIQIAPFSLAPYQQGKAAAVEREPGIQAIGYILRPDSEGSVTITSSIRKHPWTSTLGFSPPRTTVEKVRPCSAPCAGCSANRRSRTTWLPRPDRVSKLLQTRRSSTPRSTKATADTTPSERAMGPANDDVVDPSLLVRGVHNLRVVDCSVMPTMVSGNLNGPAMAMAWRAADLILAAA